MNGAPEQFRVSVLVAVCNQEDQVRRTLLGLSRQTVWDFETIVCDDGSDPAMKELVGSLASLIPSVQTVSQPDDGFRKCRILNEGIRRSRSDYLIFLDGDCIPHRRFVEQHCRLRAKNIYLAGRRVMLGPRLTESLSDGDVQSGRLERLWLTGWTWMLRGQVRHLEEGIPLPDSLLPKGTLRAKGCNFSCWKSDIETINGFNENFTTPGGGEDDDVERRLMLIGRCSRSVRHAAICYHHSTIPRERGRRKVPSCAVSWRRRGCTNAGTGCVSCPVCADRSTAWFRLRLRP